jgi:hypothetical protein
MGGAKQCKQGAAGEEERGTLMAVALEEEKTDVKDTPKSSSWWFCHQGCFKSTVMMTLGCPENSCKTHAQQVMEPLVVHQCQKQKEKTLVTEKLHSVCIAL